MRFEGVFRDVPILSYGRPLYVLDTHSFYWYIKDPSRLSPAAEAVFRLAEAGGATLIAPAIIVAEIYYLTLKYGNPLLPSQLLADMDKAGIYLSELGRAQLEQIEHLGTVSDMHDRLIAADALVHKAPVVTRDPSIREAGNVSTIW